MANLNVAPYFDDFDEFKNFHQVLFKPGFAVQARELTQLQTIIKNQVAKLGDHIFKHGSVVIPGNSFADLAVPYVKVQSTYAGNPIVENTFLGKILVGQTSGVRAYVKKVVSAFDTDPITFYLAYLSAGEDTGAVQFSQGEELRVEGLIGSDYRVNVEDTITYKGFGSLAFVNTGVYYVNGNFVSVEGQSVVISKYTQTPSCHVLLQIAEGVIDYVQDETLLDPAQGSYNFAAPGADRLKITLTLTTLPLGSTISNDFVELMRYENGELKEHARYPKYNELEKVLARRTYDESGNFVVDGLDVSVTEGATSSKLSYNVSAGKAYISGFELDSFGTKSVEVDRARTTKSESTKILANYGQYIYLASLVQGNTALGANATLTLKNAASATIGSAKVLSIDYESANVIKAYVHAISFTTGSLKDVASVSAGTTVAAVARKYELNNVVGAFSVGSTVTVAAGGSTIRDGEVVDWVAASNTLYLKRKTLGLPVVGDTVVNSTNTGIVGTSTIIVGAGQPSLIFDLGRDYVASINEVTYFAVKILTINAGSNTTESVPLDETLVFEEGAFVAINGSGLMPKSSFVLDPGGKAIKLASGTAVSTIKVYVQVVKNVTGVQKAKTKATATNQAVTLTAGRGNLANTDVFFITKVVKDGVNVTSRYNINPQLSDYSYAPAQIVSNDPSETGTIYVDYEYFAHGGSGDFFAVDSYVDGYESIPTFVSPSNGTPYTLSDCLDYRALGDVLVSGSVITVDLDRYVGRTDSVCISQSGNVVVLNGTPSDNPLAPPVSGSLYELERIRLEPYTKSPTSYVATRVGVTRYRMQDIADIEERISNLEEFSTLSSVEANLIAIPVIDAETGLDRFKTGYLAEDCTNPFGIAAWDTSEFAAYFDQDGFKAKANLTEIGFELDQTTMTNMVVKGNVMMLAHTEEVFAQVATSTRVTNLNPYLVVGWKGDMVLVPPSIEWVETAHLPEIVRSVQATITQNIRMRGPVFWNGSAWGQTPPAATNIRISPASLQNPGGALTFEMLNAAGNWVPANPGFDATNVRRVAGIPHNDELDVTRTTFNVSVR